MDIPFGRVYTSISVSYIGIKDSPSRSDGIGPIDLDHLLNSLYFIIYERYRQGNIPFNSFVKLNTAFCSSNSKPEFLPLPIYKGIIAIVWKYQKRYLA